MKDWLNSLSTINWRETFHRQNIERLSVIIIALCALGLFFGRIPKQGKLTLDNGNITYTGSLLYSKMEGSGKLTFANGDTYSGEFKNGIFHGKGTFTAASGWTYVGQFKNGLADGTGKLTTETKTIYEGTFKQGIYQNAN